MTNCNSIPLRANPQNITLYLLFHNHLLFLLSSDIKVGVEIYVIQVYGLVCRIFNGKDNRNELLLL